MKKTRPAVVSLAAALSAIVMVAPTAGAETNAGALYASCEGTRIAARNIVNGAGSTLSTVEVWSAGRDRSSTLCVRNIHKGGHYGQTLYTTVNIDGVYDRGNYAYYAGAIRRPGDWEADYDIQYGGSSPANPDRDYYCDKVVGQTAGISATTIWVCSLQIVSR